jgi:predicted HTH domain antitoxin
MNISTVVNLPQEIVLTLRQSSEDIVVEMKRALAVKYYQEQRLSLGQCAELAEMNREDFIEYLSKQHISIFRFESEDEISEDIKNA